MNRDRLNFGIKLGFYHYDSILIDNLKKIVGRKSNDIKKFSFKNSFQIDLQTVCCSSPM